jgi:hypothetical protein
VKKKVCHECTNSFEFPAIGRPPDLCPACRDARDKRKKFDEQEALKESIRLKNRAVGRRTQEGRPFQFADPE